MIISDLQKIQIEISIYLVVLFRFANQALRSLFFIYFFLYKTSLPPALYSLGKKAKKIW
nr:MAG TPA: hypothetical protein [Herelleviridae sp.]DAV56481.1 MAG TPA: hypothetical protein [Bacteriophage sp.]DAW36803.1 MAG TPA: hypothetical protein [Caudoviricetes sp.]